MKSLTDIRQLTKSCIGEFFLDICEADGNCKVIQEDSETAELIDESLEIARKLQEAVHTTCSELEALKWELSKAQKAEEVKG